MFPVGIWLSPCRILALASMFEKKSGIPVPASSRTIFCMSE